MIPPVTREKPGDCVQFLQWALPRLRLRWQGFRKVRGQVCKRIKRRIRDLGLQNLNAYRDYIEQNPEEWRALDTLCRITISRFYRDKGVFQFLEREVMPLLAGDAQNRGESELRAWSIGCASGEEPYTLTLLWDFRIRSQFPDMRLWMLATDADPVMIERAGRGCYSAGGLRELPDEWRNKAFTLSGKELCIQEEYRSAVDFLVQDVRETAPDGLFHLILCRNIAFTYFDDSLQQEVLEKIISRLLPGGVLVIGIHESLPKSSAGLAAWQKVAGVYRKQQGPAT